MADERLDQPAQRRLLGVAEHEVAGVRAEAAVPQDPLAVGLDGGEGLADRIEDRIWIEDFAGVAQEVGDAPAGSLNGLPLGEPSAAFP